MVPKGGLGLRSASIHRHPWLVIAAPRLHFRVHPAPWSSLIARRSGVAATPPDILSVSLRLRYSSLTGTSCTLILAYRSAFRRCGFAAAWNPFESQHPISN